MGEMLMELSVLIFAVIGIAEILRTVAMCILSPKNEDKMIIIVPIKGHREDVEMLLRGASYKAKFCNVRKTPKLIILDCGMDDETLDICRVYCKEFNSEIRYYKDEMESVLS